VTSFLPFHLYCFLAYSLKVDVKKLSVKYVTSEVDGEESEMDMTDGRVRLQGYVNTPLRLKVEGEKGNEASMRRST